MYLRVTDGTTSIELSQTSPVTGCTYFPQTAKRGDATIAETAVVNLAGTPAAIRALISSLEQLLEAAARRAELGVGTRVYVEYKAVAADALYRSELLDGSVQGADNPVLRRYETTSGVAAIQIGVLFQRRVWADGCSWEASAETELAISSKANGTPVTGGVTIANHTDSAHGNWVQVAAAQVIGSGPAPLRVSMRNTSGADQHYGNFYISTNAHSDPANFSHFIEAESVTSGGTVLSDSGSSNGQYVNFPVSGSGSGMLFTLPSTVMNGGGRTFRLLTRLRLRPGAPVYATPMIKDPNGLVPLATGVEVKIDTTGYLLVDLGELAIPPGAVDATSLDQLTLFLALRCATSATLSMDYIQLTPTESLRHLYQLGYSLANNDYVEDDGMLGQAYAISGGLKSAIHVQMGKPVMVWPNTLQRIYFLYDSDSGASPTAATLSIRLYYRPRRRTV